MTFSITYNYIFELKITNFGVAMRNIFLIILFSFQLFGCSIIGYNVGSSIDEMEYSSESNKMIDIDTSQYLKIFTEDHLTYVGKFQGISNLTYDEYYIKYEEVKNEYLNSVKLPELGDELINTDLQLYLNGQIRQTKWRKETLSELKEYPFFYGFDFSSFLFSKDTYENSIKIPLQMFEIPSEKTGRTFNIAKILLLLRQRKLPLTSQVKIINDNKAELISANKIVKIENQSFPVNRTVGFITGLVIDATIIYLIINSIDFFGEMNFTL